MATRTITTVMKQKIETNRGVAMIPVIVGIIVVIGVAVVLMNRGGNTGAPELGSRGDEVVGETMAQDEMMKDDEAMIEGGDAMMSDESGMMKTSGSYEMYSSDKLARANEGDVVLFFHANWCPTCRSADASIVDQLDTIPSGLTILKVDYDKETALKQKYGVRTQHTFVQVDAEGNEIAKWSGSATLAAVVSKVQ